MVLEWYSERPRGSPTSRCNQLNHGIVTAGAESLGFNDGSGVNLDWGHFSSTRSITDHAGSPVTPRTPEFVAGLCSWT